MSLSHWTCLHCEGWGCRRCAPSVDAVPSAVDLRVEDLRRQVVTLQVALVEAQCAAAVAQRELADVRRVLAAMVGAVKRGES